MSERRQSRLARLNGQPMKQRQIERLNLVRGLTPKQIKEGWKLVNLDNYVIRPIWPTM